MRLMARFMIGRVELGSIRSTRLPTQSMRLEFRHVSVCLACECTWTFSLPTTAPVRRSSHIRPIGAGKTSVTELPRKATSPANALL